MLQQREHAALWLDRVMVAIDVRCLPAALDLLGTPSRVQPRPTAHPLCVPPAQGVGAQLAASAVPMQRSRLALLVALLLCGGALAMNRGGSSGSGGCCLNSTASFFFFVF